MNKIIVLVVLLALTALHTEARKSKKHELEKAQKEVEENKEPDESEEKSEFPGFALRIPIPNFGALSHMREQLDSLFAGQKPVLHDDKSGKTKTTTTTNNSTHGPFKTYSVTSETVSTDNKSSPHILSKVYKSITTLDKDKLLKGKDGKVKVPSALEFDFGPFGPQFHDDSGERCDQSADCKHAQYCDAFLRVCRERLGDGAACTQKDQCDGKYRCTWGRCIKNSEEGSSGTFCDSDSECHSTDEELSCREQPDISRFSRVCMAKLGEGATCGHSSLFDLFRRAEDVSNYCKKGLVCRTVGFFGRRACIRGYEDNSEETKSVNDKPVKKEIKSSKSKKEEKDKKIKF